MLWYSAMLGPSQYKGIVLPVGIPIIKIRRSGDRLIFVMETPIPGKTVFILGRYPDYKVWLSYIYRNSTWTKGIIILHWRKLQYNTNISKIPNVSFTKKFYVALCIDKSNFTHPLVDVFYSFTHPCPNFNGRWAKPSLRLGYGWLITSHSLMWFY